jgi:hypothetical protein
MMILLCIDFFIVFLSMNIAFADVIPAEGSRLNYRMIGHFAASSGATQVDWEFSSPVVSDTESGAVSHNITSGGNAQELSNGNIFLSMCNPFGDMLLVDKNKRILWQATGTTCNPIKAKRQAISTYRAQMVSRVELERLIWDSPHSGSQDSQL